MRRTWLAFRDAVLGGDLPGSLAMLSPDAEMRDHRPVIGGVSHTGDELAHGIAVFQEIGVHAMDWHPIANRGERLELGHMAMHGDGVTSDSLMAAEVDDAGLIVGWDIWDMDQLDEAYAKLDERFLAGEDTVWRVVRAMHEALNAHDVGALAEVVSEQAVGVDHPPASRPRSAAAEYVGAMGRAVRRRARGVVDDHRGARDHRRRRLLLGGDGRASAPGRAGGRGRSGRRDAPVPARAPRRGRGQVRGARRTTGEPGLASRAGGERRRAGRQLGRPSSPGSTPMSSSPTDGRCWAASRPRVPRRTRCSSGPSSGRA